jgi:hypothetical protein
MNKMLLLLGNAFLILVAVFSWWYFTALWAQVKGMKTLEGVGMFITLLTPVAFALGGLASHWASRKGTGESSRLLRRYLLAALGVLLLCALAAAGLVAVAPG